MREARRDVKVELEMSEENALLGLKHFKRTILLLFFH